jgi:hypothetical protein
VNPLVLLKALIYKECCDEPGFLTGFFMCDWPGDGNEGSSSPPVSNDEKTGPGTLFLPPLKGHSGRCTCLYGPPMEQHGWKRWQERVVQVTITAGISIPPGNKIPFRVGFFIF